MNWLTAPAPSRAFSTAILLVRLAVGAAFVLHGWPKIQNATGWMGPDGPPGFLQAAAAVIEVAGGALLVLGLLHRVAAFALVAQMIAALALVHLPHGDPYVATGRPSAELAVVYLTLSLLLAATGPGEWSLDAVLFGRRAATVAGPKGFSPGLAGP